MLFVLLGSPFILDTLGLVYLVAGWFSSLSPLHLLIRQTFLVAIAIRRINNIVGLVIKETNHTLHLFHIATSPYK